jgi:hypothetical protein
LFTAIARPRSRTARQPLPGRIGRRVSRAEALGGRLDLVASFGDHTLTVTTTEAA